MSEKNAADGVLSTCQQRLEYTFSDPDLLRAAMTHASSAITRQDSNERMEFLGDAVLGLIVCQTLYERLPEAMEGELTKIKSAVVSRKICARVADKLELTEFLILGQGMEPGAHLPKSLSAAVWESVIAAVYIDGGFEAARAFILRHMDSELRSATHSEHQFNFKSQLQQHAQRAMNATPMYELLDEKGPDHSKCFEVAVTIGQKQFPGAWGPSKKEAEQKAAMIALVRLGLLDESEFDEVDSDDA